MHILRRLYRLSPCHVPVTESTFAIAAKQQAQVEVRSSNTQAQMSTNSYLLGPVVTLH